MKLTLILCSLICSLSLHAQNNGTLKGKITDYELGDSPLAFAQISFGEADITTQSTLEGYFSIDGIPPGNHNITIAYPGYQTVRKSITITDESIVDLSISMHALVLKHEDVLQAHDQ